MLNLIEQLTPLDKKRIENYISEWGTEKGYIGNDKYLSDWADSKKKLFHLLGGTLIKKIPISIEKPTEEIYKQLRNILYDTENSFFIVYKRELEKLFTTAFDCKPYQLDDYNYKMYDNLLTLVSCDSLVNNKTYLAIDYAFPNKDKALKIPVGTKALKAIQKVISYFELQDILNELFEEFRIQHSIVMNDKILKGNLCLSIHPLDFMTLSDNGLKWSSCMSWINEGCYRTGTVEMMNSNNILCCYFESDKTWNFSNNRNTIPGEEWEWSNKKWRVLTCVTKDIVVTGKAYPYANEKLSKLILENIRALAQTNLKWGYQFGPEPYSDMHHVNSYVAMENNRTWIRNGQTIKHNIIFDTKGMYNDFLNDNFNPNYFCLRNKVKKNKIISYSGKSKCLCCGDDVLEPSYDFDWSEDGYNCRFENHDSLLCTDCARESTCEICGSSGKVTVKVDGTKYCRHCFDNYIRSCPCCGQLFSPDYSYDSVIFVPVRDDAVSIENLTRDSFRDIITDSFANRDEIETINDTYGYIAIPICDECIENSVAESKAKKVKVPRATFYGTTKFIDMIVWNEVDVESARESKTLLSKHIPFSENN